MNLAIRLALARFALAALALVAAPSFAAPPEPAKPLFASDEVIHLTIQGPVDVLARGGPDSPRIETLSPAPTVKSKPRSTSSVESPLR